MKVQIGECGRSTHGSKSGGHVIMRIRYVHDSSRGPAASTPGEVVVAMHGLSPQVLVHTTTDSLTCT